MNNVVLVHGGFVDGSGWEGVYKTLTRNGYSVTVVQNPTMSLEDDVAYTKRALAAKDGPAILVGHSYGGAVITEAGNDPKVTGLSDHRSTVGVANENRRAVLCCQSSLGVRYVVFQRHRRILDDGDTVTVSRQGLVDALPSRAVHKATVNQDNVVHNSQSPFLTKNVSCRSEVRFGWLDSRIVAH